MTLEKLDINDKAIVKSINCDSVLKNRFYSLGLVKSSIITLKERTLTKSTLEIEINNTKLALRFNEASKIEVERI